MDIIRFIPGGGAQPRVGVSDGQVVIELGTATVAELLRQPAAEIRRRCERAREAGRRTHLLAEVTARAPVDERTEVWAAGVTYELSQRERMKESVGAAAFYQQVYDAERPELFFKSAAWRVAGPGQPIAVRADSVIDVPEPELALVLNARAEICGYTICVTRSLLSRRRAAWDCRSLARCSATASRPPRRATHTWRVIQ